MTDEKQALGETDAVRRAIERASTDLDFRKRLIADPKAALAEAGAVLPEGWANVTLKVVENTPHTLHIVLPAVQGDGPLDDAELDGIAGGAPRTTNSEIEEGLE